MSDKQSLSGLVYVKNFDSKHATVQVCLREEGKEDRHNDKDEIGFYQTLWDGIKVGDKIWVMLEGVHKVPHRGYPSAMVFKTKKEAEGYRSPSRPDLNQRIIEATVEEMP